MLNVFLLTLAAIFAVVFPQPHLVNRIVRVIVQHRRDCAAWRALRRMRYTDIRRVR
jgi:hypothetical protein